MQKITTENKYKKGRSKEIIWEKYKNYTHNGIRTKEEEINQWSHIVRGLQTC